MFFYENTIDLLNGDMSLGTWLYYMEFGEFLLLMLLMTAIVALLVVIFERKAVV